MMGETIYNKTCVECGHTEEISKEEFFRGMSNIEPLPNMKVIYKAVAQLSSSFVEYRRLVSNWLATYILGYAIISNGQAKLPNVSRGDFLRAWAEKEEDMKQHPEIYSRDGYYWAKLDPDDDWEIIDLYKGGADRMGTELPYEESEFAVIGEQIRREH